MSKQILDVEKIYELYVVQKKSCKEVSEILGVNRSSVKSYIYKHKLSQNYEKECLYCGKKFISKRADGKFCSEECYNKYRNANFAKYKYPESGMRICEECGKEYYYDINNCTYTKDNGKHINASKFCSYECGVKNAVRKQSETNLEKYGTTCCLQGKEIHEKVVKTWQNKYGVDCIGKAKEIQEKIKKTNLEKYGDECIFGKNSTLYPKIQQIVYDKYGVDNVFQSEEIQEKIKKTNLERYGVEYPIQSPEIQAKYNHDDMYKKTYQTKKKNGTLSTSGLEKEVKNFIESLGFIAEKYITGRDSTRFEIDIYVPGLKIGIECNGNWWHSTNRKPKNYHYKKYLLAKEKGIDLIQVWEDQWKYQQEIIKDILKARLGVISKDNKIYARKCIIKEIENNDYRAFCINNHIQGYRPAKIRYGLYYNGILVQIASFNKCKQYGKRKPQAEYEWIRGCIASNNFVIGGTSKLLKHFIDTHDPDSILCYADANLFNGQGYKEAGFTFEGYTGPDKFYVENNTLIRHGRNPYKYKEYKEKVKTKKFFECHGVGSLKFTWRKGAECGQS